MHRTQQCKALMPTLLRWTEKDVRTDVGCKGAAPKSGCGRQPAPEAAPTAATAAGPVAGTAISY